MLSRVAECVYWMNRYVERAENVARFVDVSLHLALDDAREAQRWGALVATTGDAAPYRARYGEPTRDGVLEFLAFDRDNPSSVVSCLGKARDNARQVRDVISSEMWEQLNKAYWMASDPAQPRASKSTPHAFFTAVKEASALYIGLSYVTMTHNEAWHFGRLGRLLERADQTSRILDVTCFWDEASAAPSGVGPKVARSLDESQWAALLKSASAFEMYRKRHGLIQAEKVVDFLMLERKFPRSVLYCLTKAERSLHAITGTPLGTSEHAAERALGRLHAKLEYVTTDEILARGLHEYVDELQIDLNALGDAIRESFFAAPPAPHPPPDEAGAQQQ